MKKSVSAPCITSLSLVQPSIQAPLMKRNVSTNAVAEMIYMLSTIPIHRVADCIATTHQFPIDILTQDPSEIASMGLCLAEPSEVPENNIQTFQLERQYIFNEMVNERYINMLFRIRKKNKDAKNGK
jgi:hypothetical protein